jgi:diguanylate cyclase (GGDEF)-like protein
MPYGRRLLACAGLVASVSVFAVMPFAGSQTARFYAFWIMLTTCGGAVLHITAALRARGSARRIWCLTAAGLACWGVAEVSVGVPALVTGVAPARTDAINLLNLGAFVLAVAAMLILPGAPRDRAGKLRMLLDGVVAGAALFGVSWVLVLQPLERIETAKAARFDLAYPIIAVGVVAVAVVLLAGHRARDAGAMRALIGGVLVVALMLLVEVGAKVSGVAWLMPWVRSGYVASAALLAIAPLFPLPEPAGRVWQPSSPAAGMIPYVPLVGYAVFCAGPTLFGRSLDRPEMFSGAIVMCALLGRQFLTIRTNAMLTRDLAEQRSRFEIEAVHDSLTGLPNRAMLRSVGDDAVLLMIDLDGFKAVNDTFGHAAGDALLVEISRRLRTVIAPLGEDATGARLGGDEFAVLLRRGGLPVARDLAVRLLEACARPVPLDGRTASVRASIGIAASRPGGSVLHEADLALYEAKHRGKGQYRLFDHELAAAVEAQRLLESELGVAIAAGQFELLHQPVVSLTRGIPMAAEAVLRWQHPRLGPLAAADFLPAAADAGLLPEIDRWVISTGVGQLAGRPEGFLLGVRLSARYLGAGTVAADLRQALSAAGVPASALVVLITDAVDLTGAAPVLREIRALGVQVCLEGFGVGHSAVAHLRTFEVDVIKLHPAFLHDLDDGPSAVALLGAVIARATGVGLACVADGVSLPSQVSLLRDLGCLGATGPLFGGAGQAGSAGAGAAVDLTWDAVLLGQLEASGISPWPTI